MTIDKVHTTNDFNEFLAEAAENRDPDPLYQLEHRVRHWLQPDEETEMQVRLIDAVRELCYEARDAKRITA